MLRALCKFSLYRHYNLMISVPSVIPTLRVRKLKLREVQEFTKGYTIINRLSGS